MRTIIAAAALLLAGCIGSTADAQWIVEHCAGEVDRFTGFEVDGSIYVLLDEPAGASMHRRNGESAACVLGVAGAPAGTPADITSTPEGATRSAQWDGWRAVWSIDGDYGLQLTLSPR